MKSMKDYLAELAEAKDIPSDRQLAKYLGLTKQAVSKWKTRGYSVDPDTAWKIAEGIGADPLEVIAASEIERAQRMNDAERIGVWRKRLASVGTSLGTVFIAVFLFLAPGQPAHAGASPAAAEAKSIYIMLNYQSGLSPGPTVQASFVAFRSP